MLSRGNVGSRRERRRTARQEWMLSHPHKEIMRRAELYRQRVQRILTRRAAA